MTNADEDGPLAMEVVVGAAVADEEVDIHTLGIGGTGKLADDAMAAARR
jgi:hypothetical protein